jgi:hypothetical protein
VTSHPARAQWRAREAPKTPAPITTKEACSPMVGAR